MEGQNGSARSKQESLEVLCKTITPIQNLPPQYRKSIDRGMSTGWACLDYYMQGIRKGEVTVVTADTGVGKTTLCTHLVVNCAIQKAPVWINSWEMKPEVTMRKVASIILRKPMKTCEFSDDDWNKFALWCSDHALYVNKNTTGTDLQTLAQDLSIARELGVKVVMLDHLDYLVNFKREKMHEAIDDTVKKLHELAFALDMHFFLICHPRQSATGFEEIGMHALKGSSSIKQYADNILILHRCSRTDSKAEENKVRIQVAKNRMFGIEGSAYLYYQPKWDGYAS